MEPRVIRELRDPACGHLWYTVQDERSTMKEIIGRLLNKGLTAYSDEDLSKMMRRTVVAALKDARFSDALPDPYIHEITLLASQSIAEGGHAIVIQLVTEDRGVASFYYPVDTTPTGVRIAPATEWFVPKKGSDRKLPVSFDGVARLAIDVSVFG
jgi:hypothetical protein